MTTSRSLLLVGLSLLACLLPVSGPVQAAESYDNCTGFINSLPTTITTQGVWCLQNNVSTSITSGNAIEINANNVTIDCNNFKIGGLAAGSGSAAIGIYASNRQNVTIRHCNIRGFKYGVRVTGSGAGHLIEDNRLDNNLYIGIYLTGDNAMVRRNRIYDTGGESGAKWAYGINASADIIDNTISGLFADVAGGFLKGIDASEDGAVISGNTISGYDMTAVQGGAVDSATGIFTSGQHTRIANNQISGGDLSAISGPGIFVNGTIYSSAYCIGNTVGGFTTNYLQCDVSIDNMTIP